MKNMKIALTVVALLAGSVPFLAAAEDNTVPRPEAQKPDNQQTYEIKNFFVNYQPYSVGDSLPGNYLEDQYKVADWQKRHLPAPQEGSHWAYLNGNYIMVAEADTKVLQAISGDIYFR
ncbi:nickel/cobalt homeostasis protein RcnB [Enterobacterales bacterium CwR94]|nr:nickel/cobalt homeostasis protein RcnB [Enterobacterales bacterium CwR94]